LKRPAAATPAIVATLLVAVSTPLSAFEFATEGGAVTGYFDTTVSFGALWRTQSRSPSLIAIANGGTSRDINSDDGNLNYRKGELVELPFQALFDFSLTYRDYGLFARAVYFYDKALNDNAGLGEHSKSQVADYTQLLDVYAYGKFDVFGRGLFVRAGDQVVNWGASTFIQNGISILNPVDVRKLRTPNAEIKDALSPTPMLRMLQELTDRFSVEGIWMPRWDGKFPDTHVRLDPHGSFFSTRDFGVTNGASAYTGFGRRNDLHGAPGVFPTNAGAALGFSTSTNGERNIREENGFQYGIALHYLIPGHSNTEVSVYHINYHARTEIVSGIRGGLQTAATISGNLTPDQVAALGAAGIPAVAAGDPACAAVNLPTFDALQTPANIARLAPIVGGVANATALSAQNATNAACAAAAGRTGSLFVDYPTHIKLWGVSASTGLPGGVTLQGEYSYRGNQPLQLPLAEVLLAVGGSANQLTGTDPDTANQVPYGTEVSGFRRVKMHQLLASATKTFGPTLGAAQAVAVAEIGYTHVDLPGDLKFAGRGCHLPQPGSDTSSAYNSTSTHCFATANSWGYRLAGRIDYDNVIDGGTVTPYAAFAHDVSGVGPTFNEGAKALTLGVTVSYLKRWQAQVAYTSYFGGKTYSGTDAPNASSGPLPPGQSAAYSSGSNPLRDRDFVSVGVSYAF
jgi:hypothetical protein